LMAALSAAAASPRTSKGFLDVRLRVAGAAPPLTICRGGRGPPGRRRPRGRRARRAWGIITPSRGLVGGAMDQGGVGSSTREALKREIARTKHVKNETETRGAHGTVIIEREQKDRNGLPGIGGQGWDPLSDFEPPPLWRDETKSDETGGGGAGGMRG